MKLLLSLITLYLSLFHTSCTSLKTNDERSEIQIISIIPEYIKHEEFVSIKEYLTGKETTKNRLILRSIDRKRTGLYLTVSLNKKVTHLPADTQIICEIFMPGELNAKIFEFPLPKVNHLPKTRHLLLGLTGKDWDYEDDALPTAWKITLVDSKERIIARKSSQVWSL
tara:strand:- start:510 stop:1013 length:504 start_codon:yes stop_codon:yes gene_type:complete